MANRTEQKYERYRAEYDRMVALREEVVALKKEWEEAFEADQAARKLGADPELLSEDELKALRVAASKIKPSNGDGVAVVEPVIQNAKGGE